MTKSYIFIDPVAIQENLMQNSELIRQFLHLYKTQIPTDFVALREAMETEDHERISSRAHHIKPTMEYIGATELRADLQHLETAAKEAVAINELQILFDDLEKKFDTLLQEIDTYLSSLD